MRVEFRDVKAVASSVIAQLGCLLERWVLSALTALGVQVLAQCATWWLDGSDDRATSWPASLRLLDVVNVVLMKVSLTILVLEDLGHDALGLGRVGVDGGAV